MLSIFERLDKDLINPSLTSKDKCAVLKEMASMLIDKGLISDSELLIEKLMEREEIETTGVGHSVAIPHARTECIDGIAICFGIAKHGIDYDSLDGKPAQIFFLIASDEENKNTYIKLLARISWLCRKESFRKRVLDASTAQDILKIFREEESV